MSEGTHIIVFSFFPRMLRAEGVIDNFPEGGCIWSKCRHFDHRHIVSTFFESEVREIGGLELWFQVSGRMYDHFVHTFSTVICMNRMDFHCQNQTTTI